AVLDLSHLPGPRVDKHSTGGVGDKVSLVLAPLAAACGLYVPMMSGRGLGHTGGTLDKLEAIPGFRTDLSLERFAADLETHRVAMIGQTAEIAPLDRRLYALRSVSGTVPSIPLIAASIMSKKLAEGLTGLVLDVKMGSGAFLPDEDRAMELARTMVEMGARHGVPTTALPTAMDRPLGRTVGNALEVREALECLRGGGPDDLREVTVALVVEMLAVSEPAESAAGGGASPDGGHADGSVGSRTPAGSGGPTGSATRGSDRDALRTQVEERLDAGAALELFRALVERQGGDPHVVDDAGRLPQAPVQEEVRSSKAGVVLEVQPFPLGRASVELGGGRIRLGQEIDPAVGFASLVQPGDEVAEGDLLGVVHAARPEDAPAAAAVLRDAVRIGAGAPTLLPLLGTPLRRTEP
ncbi:MAG: thymidine phosphorylase, partial [Gemmatimonadales bacterium]